MNHDSTDFTDLLFEKNTFAPYHQVVLVVQNLSKMDNLKKYACSIIGLQKLDNLVIQTFSFYFS